MTSSDVDGNCSPGAVKCPRGAGRTAGRREAVFARRARRTRRAAELDS
ncbi:hypothetical protein [Kitasatospora cinereorecta]